MMAAAIVIKRIAYLRVLPRVVDVTIPILPSKKRTMGTSKVMPKAKIMAVQNMTNFSMDIIARIGSLS